VHALHSHAREHRVGRRVVAQRQHQRDRVTQAQRDLVAEDRDADWPVRARTRRERDALAPVELTALGEVEEGERDPDLERRRRDDELVLAAPDLRRPVDLADVEPALDAVRPRDR
jgi:hypothetical protein